MSLVRRIARPLAAAMYLTGGYQALRDPGGRVQAATPFIQKVAGPLGLPNDPELLVRINGGAMLGAGALFASGRLPRLAALVLAATMAPTTYVGHPFWDEADPAKRANQRIHFTKNLSMIGAMLLASVDTAGKPSLAWRTQHLSRSIRREARLAALAAGRKLS